MSTDLSGLGQRLKDIRKNNSLTQPVMAAVIDVSDRTYKYYEQEKREMPAQAAVKICERFNLSVEWLLTGKGRASRNDEAKLAEACSLAALQEHSARRLDLNIVKLSKIIGFVAEQAAHTGEDPEHLAKRYFDTL